MFRYKMSLNALKWINIVRKANQAVRYGDHLLLVVKVTSIVRLAQLLSSLVSVRKVLSSIPGPVKSDTVSPTARHRCDVSVLPRH